MAGFPKKTKNPNYKHSNPRKSPNPLPVEAAKKPTGRPPVYKPEYDELAERLKLLGLNEPEIAKAIGISVNQLRVWVETRPSFKEACANGGDLADARVAQALYSRAMGYSHKAEKIMVVDKSVARAEYTEHYPPDTNAAMLWLANRNPDKWKLRPGEDGKNDTNVTTITVTGGLPDEKSK